MGKGEAAAAAGRVSRRADLGLRAVAWSRSNSVRVFAARCGRELDAGRLHVALLLYEGLSKFEFERVEEGS